MKPATDWSYYDNNEEPADNDAPHIQTINDRPAIRLPGDGHLLSDFAAELGKLVASAGVYNRRGTAFVLDATNERLKPAEPGWLRSWVEKYAMPYKVKKIGPELVMRISRSMSKDNAEGVLAAEQFLACLPTVERLHPCPMPYLRANGAIELLPVGLDNESQTITLDPGFQVTPTPFDEAKNFVNSLLSEFPFADDNGRSKGVAIAAMLTTFAEGIMPQGSLRPVFIYIANAEGAGKTTLAKLAGFPYRELPTETAPTEEAEWQKRLLALTISGRRVVLLDNAKGHLNSPALEGYATSTTYAGRILGHSREFVGEAGATILVTGNGVTVSPDLRRRSLFVELFMHELKAEDRVFRRSLSPVGISKLRTQALSALWGLVRAWDAAGRPKASRTNPAFPEWCATIAGIVEHAGWACPVASADLGRGGDTDTSDFQKLAGCMGPEFRYTFAELIELAEDEGLFERVLADRDNDNNLTRAARRVFSSILSRFDRRRVTPSLIFSLEGHGHQRRYCLTSTL